MTTREKSPQVPLGAKPWEGPRITINGKEYGYNENERRPGAPIFPAFLLDPATGDPKRKVAIKYKIQGQCGYVPKSELVFGHYYGFIRDQIAGSGIMELLDYEKGIEETVYRRPGSAESKIEHKDRIISVNEWVDGVTLDKTIDRSTRRVRRLVLSVLTSLDVFARNGLQHCDIKPENLMVDGESDDVRIVDIDCVGLICADEKHMKFTNVRRMPSGSVTYMPPERRAGATGYNMDLFALGMTAISLIKPLGMSAFDIVHRYAIDGNRSAFPVTNFSEKSREDIREMMRCHVKDREGRISQQAEQLIEFAYRAIDADYKTRVQNVHEAREVLMK